MSGESSDEDDFLEMSDAEIRELAEEFNEAVPEAMAKALGFDLFSGFKGQNREEIDEELTGQIEELFIGVRDALSEESDEEQAIAMFDVYDQAMENFVMSASEREEFDTGVDFLVEELRTTLEESSKGMKWLGYSEYFDLMDDLAIEIVEVGYSQRVKEFFDGLDGNSLQILTQRIMNPMITEYYGYVQEHQEISDADDALRYTEIYNELAELTGNVLPQFIAVLQIKNGREEKYSDLRKMGLNNLLQKLGAKKYSRFNRLANGLDRRLRNSIAHRDFTVDPIDDVIEFYDRGEFICKLTYSEFQGEVFHLLALFNALWVFRLMLTFYRLQGVSEAVKELREDSKSR